MSEELKREPCADGDECPYCMAYLEGEYGHRRTCHDFGGEEGTNGEMYDFACSACGYVCDLPEPNYCPNCGARVVSEEEQGHMVADAIRKLEKVVER